MHWGIIWTAVEEKRRNDCKQNNKSDNTRCIPASEFCYKVLALGDKKGIARYGSMNLPMDEVLCNVTLDISGRPYLVFNCELIRENIGTMSCEMVEEFFRAFCVAAGVTLHINVYYGKNDHHKVEAIFKAFGRALKQAVKIESDRIPSSKGVIE